MKTKQLYNQYIEQKARLEQEVKSGEWKHFGTDEFSKRISSFDGLAAKLQKAGLHVSTFAGLGLLAFPLSDMQGQCITDLSDYNWRNIDWTDGISTNDRSKAAFVDLDGDGDLDMVVNGVISINNNIYGVLRYFENTGNAENPVFEERTGLDNPFDDILIINGGFYGSKLAPAFTDIDGDGNQDLFVGEKYGNIYGFLNTGTSVNPAFNAIPDFNYNTGFDEPVIAFADLDGDGDQDLIFGEKYGRVGIMPNAGSSPYFPVAYFPAIPGTSNTGYFGYKAAPTLADFDCDGDQDMVLGFFDEDYYSFGDRLKFFENTGTSASFNFVERKALSDKLTAFKGSEASLRPTAVDLDNDDDIDIVFGTNSGILRSLEALRQVPPIPTLSQWGIIILGLFVSILGLLGIRRTKRSVKISKTNSIVAILLSAGTLSIATAQNSSPHLLNVAFILNQPDKFETFAGSEELQSLLNKYEVELFFLASKEGNPKQKVVSLGFESPQKIRRFMGEFTNTINGNRYGVQNALSSRMLSLYTDNQPTGKGQYMVGIYRVNDASSWIQTFDKNAVGNMGMKIKTIAVENKERPENSKFSGVKKVVIQMEKPARLQGDQVVILYEVTNMEKAKASTSGSGFEAEMNTMGLKPVRNRSGFYVIK